VVTRVEFKEILTIPTVGTEQDQAEGTTFICRHDVDGALLADNKTICFAMKSLTVRQLRIFATKFEVPQSLVMKRDQAFLNLMVAFKQNPNSVKMSITKRAAAIQLTLDAKSIGTNHLILTLFGSTFKVLYAQLNNDKDHTGYEITFGANNKIFWNNVVDSVNCGDGEDEEAVNHKLLPCKDGYMIAKEYRGYMAAAANEDPGLVLPVPLTIKGAQRTISYLLKARKIIETNMHEKTGMGEPDVMEVHGDCTIEGALCKAHCFPFIISTCSVPSTPMFSLPLQLKFQPQCRATRFQTRKQRLLAGHEVMT
jgi:hypothetical protein